MLQLLLVAVGFCNAFAVEVEVAVVNQYVNQLVSLLALQHVQSLVHQHVRKLAHQLVQSLVHQHAHKPANQLVLQLLHAVPLQHRVVAVATAVAVLAVKA